MKRRVWSTILCLSLMLTLLPTAAFAANNPTTVKVGGTDVATEEESYWVADTVNGGFTQEGASGDEDGYQLKFTPASAGHIAVLTLNNADINGGSGEDDEDAAIYVIGAPLELHLIGESYVTKDAGGDSRSAIKAYGHLTITAENETASVEVTARGGTRENYGIYCAFDKSYIDVNLTVQSGIVYAEAGGDTPETVSNGVRVNGDLTISGGRLTGHSTNLSAQSAAGIYVRGSSGGNITVTGGALCALCDAGTFDCNGIYCFRNLNVSGGTVAARSDKICIRPDFGKTVLSPDARQVSGVGTDSGVEYNYTQIDCGWLVFLVNGEPLYLTEELMDGRNIDAVTLHTGTNTFAVKSADGYSVYAINGEPVSGSEPFEFSVDKIESNKSISIALTKDGELGYRTFNIRTLNSRMPELTTAGEAQTDGDFFLSFINSRSIVQMDKGGNILFYRCEEQPKETIIDTIQVDLSPYGLWDFKQHKVGDTVYYSYHSADVTPISLYFDGHAPGRRVILNADYSAANTVGGRGVNALDGHDFLMLGENHYLTLQYRQVQVNNIPEQDGDRYVTAAYVEERKDGNVVFSWLSTDYPELYAMTATNADAHAADFDNRDAATPVDYVHANSMALDADGNLLLSCRHLNAVLKIDRTSEAGSGQGDILWVLGGTGNTVTGADDTNKPLVQHYFQPLGGGYYSLFSNNNGTSSSQSLPMVYRIVKNGEGYALDAADSYAPEAIVGDVGIHPFSVACGSFQRIGDYGIVGWGADYNNSALATEFALATGTPTFSISAKNGKTYARDPENGTYRIVKHMEPVAPDPAYAITATPTTLAFDSAYTGGSQPAARTVTITNTGNQSITLTQPTATNYDVGTLSKATLAADETATFTVTPKAGLGVGAHDETITVFGTNNTSASVDVTFTVQQQGSGNDPTPETVYAATDGAGGTWTHGAAKGLAFTFNAPYSHFRSLRLDGATVAASNYDKREGSTVITLHADYLKTLPVGTHTLRASFSGGYAQTTFTISEEDKTTPDTGFKNPFTDVKKAGWFFDDVMFVFQKGLMTGTSNTTFAPSGTTTRGMIMTILYRLEKEPVITGDCPFDDVTSGKYYEDAVTWAVANHIVDGYSGSKFGPEDAITREQMAAILYRYAAYKGYDVSKAANLDAYTDAGSISSYALAPMKWTNANGIVNGDGNQLMPAGNAARCQVAAIIHRFYKLFA